MSGTPDKLLEVDGLVVDFKIGDDWARAINGVSFDVLVRDSDQIG